MDNVMIISIIYFIGIAILLVANELYYRHLGVKGEYSRKFAHITATLATLPFPYIIPSHWYILVLALIFLPYFTLLIAVLFSTLSMISVADLWVVISFLYLFTSLF